MRKSGNLKQLLSDILRLFPNTFKRKLFLLTVLQSMSNLLDLVGVLIFGLVGSITITTIQSTPPNQTIVWLTDSLHISNFSAEQQVVLLASISILVLILKSIYASYLQKYTMAFLSNSGVGLTVDLTRRMMSSTLDIVRQRSEKQTLYAVTSGVEEMTLRVLGAAISILSDIVLMLLLGSVLLISAPLMAITMLGVFLIFFLLIQKLVNNRARELGGGVTKTTIQSNEVFSIAYSAYKELVVRGQTEYIIQRLQTSRQKSAKYQAETAFLPFVSKYLMEAAVLIVGFSIAAVGFMTSDASGAAGKLGLFFIASTRIAPALMRLQQSFYSLNMGAGPASETVKIAKSLATPKLGSTPNLHDQSLSTSIVLTNCSYNYKEPGAIKVISNVNLEIPQGSKLAVVGPSGSGKTTLANLILGLVEPTSGEILIAGISPRDLATMHTGYLGYVPQDPYISNDSIRMNITLGYNSDAFTDEYIWDTLEAVNLGEIREISKNNLNTIIGETGIKLSGGQRQKLAIARIALQKPKILILDEATSALDADSEFKISELVNKLFKDCTIITIAHRLSTISEYPRIVYLSNGEIQGEGNFSQLRKKIKDFDNQAKKMGF